MILQTAAGRREHGAHAAAEELVLREQRKAVQAEERKLVLQAAYGEAVPVHRAEIAILLQNLQQAKLAAIAAWERKRER